ncbi:hypothetical protein BTIS_0818 [Bifidobacterium tissieri]|uniref:Uncharacterized protein n=1 Tax=Bifidobacterium tissieri TaxID=1630162 RepID=A0A261FH35_9BIFI|nr:hypothetical protein BTIS_0818 [Bifidobacterium tissieri]
MPVPDRQVAGPHRQRTGNMDVKIEARIERVHHRLRRPLVGRQELTIKLPVTHLKRQSPSMRSCSMRAKYFSSSSTSSPCNVYAEFFISGSRNLIRLMSGNGVPSGQVTDSRRRSHIPDSGSRSQQIPRCHRVSRIHRTNRSHAHAIRMDGSSSHHLSYQSGGWTKNQATSSRYVGKDVRTVILAIYQRLRNR